QRFERLVDDHRIAKRSRRRFREDVEPARRDDADAKRDIARVDEMNFHRVRAQSRQLQTSRAAWSVNAESVMPARAEGQPSCPSEVGLMLWCSKQDRRS